MADTGARVLRRICSVATGLLAASLALVSESAQSIAAPFFTGLGDLPGGSFRSDAQDVSADGTTVVGWSDSELGQRAFIWILAAGMKDLGHLPEVSATAGTQAYGVSADGTVVVGHSGGLPFRWSSASGIESIDRLPGATQFSAAWDVSADGATAVGSSGFANGLSQAFRWSESEGTQALGLLPTATEPHSLAFGSSGDGLIVVGPANAGPSGNLAFRWAPATGMQSLGDLPGGALNSVANAVSIDGTTIVGQGTSTFQEAFRWAESDGMQALGTLSSSTGTRGGAYSTAWGVSGDGSVVVGESRFAAFIWDPTSGMRNLHDVLSQNFGFDLSGWQLDRARSISADGTVIVGEGRNPSGHTEAWIARITDLPVLPANAPLPLTFPQPARLLQELPAFISAHRQEISSDALSFIDGQLIRLGNWASNPSVKQWALDAAEVLGKVGLLAKMASIIPTAQFDPVRGLIGLAQFFVTAPVAAIDDPQTKFELQSLLITQTLNGCVPVESCLLSINAWIWGALLPYQLRQFGNDPPSSDYLSTYVPRLPAPTLLPSTGDAALDKDMWALFNAAFRAQGYVDAINKSLDRYAGALGAGDGQAALLQVQAILHYLALYDEAVQDGARQLLLIQGAIDDITYNPDILQQLLDVLRSDTGLEAFDTFFTSLGLDSEEVTFIRDSILELDPDEFSGTLFSALTETGAAARSFSTATFVAAVPEPNAGLLLLPASLLIAIRRRPSCQRKMALPTNQVITSA